MVKAVSWSELDCWERSPENWYMAYVLGLKEPTNPAMQRGTDIHKYLFAPTEEREEIMKDWTTRYNAGEVRVHKRIAGSFDAMVAEKLPNIEHEIKMSQEVEGIPTFTYWDGYHKEQEIILEVKTGGQRWDQRKAEEHGQIHLYAAQWQCMNRTGDIPTVWLFSASTENGRADLFQFKPSERDMMRIRKRLKDFWNNIAEHRAERVMGRR